MKANSNLSVCKQHSQLFSHYCIAPGCKKLLCIKCVDPHKVFHGGSTSIIQILQIYQILLDQMNIYHDKLGQILKGINLCKKYEAKLQKTKENLQENISKIKDWSTEIDVCAQNKQNSKIGERLGEFFVMKKKLSKILFHTVGIIYSDVVYEENILTFHKEIPLSIIKLDLTLSPILKFIDPFFFTNKIYEIPHDIKLSKNSTAYIVNNSIFIISGQRGELFESQIMDIANPHIGLHFVNRADLVYKLTKSYQCLSLQNAFLYLISIQSNQKYSIFSDQWFPLPPLRIKETPVLSLIFSYRSIYALRGKPGCMNIEILDLLFEEQGWKLIIPKWNFSSPKIPLSENSVIFQQNTEQILILGNTKTQYHIKTSDFQEPKFSVALLFDIPNQRFEKSAVKISELQQLNADSIKDNENGKMCCFTETNYDELRIWLYDKYRIKCGLSYKIPII